MCQSVLCYVVVPAALYLAPVGLLTPPIWLLLIVANGLVEVMMSSGAHLLLVASTATSLYRCASVRACGRACVPACVYVPVCSICGDA